MSEMNTKPVKITGIKFFTFSIIKIIQALTHN